MVKLEGMLNFSGGEFLVILFIALILIGPERLPQFAAQLARLVRTLKEMMAGATSTLKDELGEDFEELQKFDPRQYDPRRIVREALLEDVVPATKRAPSAMARAAGGVAAAGAAGAAAAADKQIGAPFDDEAT